MALRTQPVWSFRSRLSEPESLAREAVPIYLEFYFWLVAINVACFMAERFAPWRKSQPALREDILQDGFWFLFNTNFVGWMIALASVYLLSWLDAAFLGLGMPTPKSLQLISGWPLLAQFCIAYLIKDFIAWNIHRMLHTVPFLWKFHKLHHSITELDWLTTFRAHWGEAILYKSITYLPLVALGVDEGVIFATIVLNNLIQTLAHSNLNLDWGPFRYVFVSPRFHAWHHDLEMHGKGGQNFAVELTIWDWVFGTAFYPKDRQQPEKYGFKGLAKFPKGIVGRILYPFVTIKGKKPAKAVVCERSQSNT